MSANLVDKITLTRWSDTHAEVVVESFADEQLRNCIGNPLTCTIDISRGIQIETLAGNDRITIDPQLGLNLSVSTGAGNDTVTINGIAERSSITVQTGNGTDVLELSSHIDTRGLIFSRGHVELTGRSYALRADGVERVAVRDDGGNVCRGHFAPSVGGGGSSAARLTPQLPVLPGLLDADLQPALVDVRLNHHERVCAARFPAKKVQAVYAVMRLADTLPQIEQENLLTRNMEALIEPEVEVKLAPKKDPSGGNGPFHDPDG